MVNLLPCGNGSSSLWWFLFRYFGNSSCRSGSNILVTCRPALEAGCIDYITKPLQPAEVLARIDTHLNIYRLQQELKTKSEKLLLTNTYRGTSVKEYLNNLIDQIIKLFPDNLKLTVNKKIADFKLESKRMVPLGMIVNELLTDAMKYAFAGKTEGTLHIKLIDSQKKVTLTIQDDGNGLPEGFNITKSTGFGLMLINILCEQLEGTFQITNKNGTKSTLEFRN